MIIRSALAGLSALLFVGCCFGGVPAAPGPMPTVGPAPVMPPMPVPSISGSSLPGAGILPTPPLSFAGIAGPMPIPGVPAGTGGEILTSGTATVRIAAGSLPGVAAGTVCSYAQFRVDTTGALNCRWNVTCGTNVVYGSGTAGYQVCSDPSWPPGVLMMDSGMTSSDGDGMFIFNAGGMTIGDDSGPLGAFTLTLTVP